MEKVKAPETGWLSAETACQATVYVPSGSPVCSSMPYLAVRRSQVWILPESTRLPLGSRTRIALSPRATCSEKVRVT